MVLGKPSRTNPFSQSFSLSRSATRSMINGSGTNSPRRIYSEACLPSTLCSATALRRISPVEICGAANFSSSNFAWVPLPAPGGPSNTTRAPAANPSAPSPAQPPSFHEAFVVAADQMGLHLGYRIQGDADNDQQRGPAKVKRHVQLADQQRRQQANYRQINRPAESDTRKHALDEVGGFWPWADAGNVTAEFFHVFGDVHRVEHYRGVKKRKKDDQGDEDDIMQPLTQPQRPSHHLHPSIARELRQGRGKNQHRRSEDRRYHVGSIDLERQVGALAAVHLAPDHALGILDRNAALAALDKNDHADHDDG